MKVTFIFSGLPHYLIALLNRLVAVHGIDLSLILPRERGMSLGEGVKLGMDGSEHKFTIYYLEEFPGKMKKPYFKNLDKCLEEISPDILVMGWPYIINFSLDKQARKVIKHQNISLVFREIPFMVAPRNRALKYYRKHPVINENLEVDNPRGIKFIPWAIALNQMRIRYYKLADATMIYASHGFTIHESFGIERDRVFLTYNSPDTEKIADTRQKVLAEEAISVNPKRILHVGRLVKWKRVDLLINAVAHLSARHSDLELHIIGEGPEEAELKQLSEKLAPEGMIIFHGSIYDPARLARETMASAVYVLAGMGGLSINEAMAYGKPVICSRCDGTEKDLIADGVNGLYFREGDFVDLSLKIEILLNDPHKRQAMGEEAFRVINEKINLGSVSQRFADCFDYLMQSKAEC